MIPADAANLTVEPLGKLAGNAHASCPIRLDGVRATTGQVLGGPRVVESAWPTLRLTGILECLNVSAMACGLAHAATLSASAFIRERHQFGEALTGFQSIQHAVVEMSTVATGMQLFLEHALRAHAAGTDATQAISMAKYFCSEQLQQVVEKAVRVMGGRAYFDFEPVSRFYREAPFCLFAVGTVEIQKMLIARMLGL
ncbi:acyl-CoA dehydrogenase family protein [Paraburkholderia sp. IW21]|uniref:acyl-CoA dehydrogenase family protein n=1 Tax=Paraburkholderia sp. IW21 TaxID=3242488 RepID=UPI003520E9CF